MESRFREEKSSCGDCASNSDDMLTKNFDLFNSFISSNDIISQIFGYLKSLLHENIKEDKTFKMAQDFYDRYNNYPLSFRKETSDLEEASHTQNR